MFGMSENVPTFPCPSSEMYVLTYITYTRSNSSSTCEISNSAHIAENIKNEKENFCKISLPLHLTSHALHCRYCCGL